MSYRAQAAAVRVHLETSPLFARLRDLTRGRNDLDADLLGSVLDEAARFGEHRLAPINRIGDREGCRLEAGRVRMPAAYREAWRAFTDAGWNTLDHPTAYGGQGLPLALQSGCQEMFDRACVAFGMMPGAQRAAARLIAAHGDARQRDAWLPGLASAKVGACIVVSEPDAGSDVGRIRTQARRRGDGTWLVTGEKIWISFGDHDLSEQILYCLLARTPDGAAGGAGLSIFLVPSVLPDGRRNGVAVRRIEEKLGLHGSPTCALGFEDAQASLLGIEGRGLSQIFAMITCMRILTAVQGVGVACGAAETALAYAAERRQGGPAAAPAVPIDRHADVQRQLLDLLSRVEVARGLTLTAATLLDLAEAEPDDTERKRAAVLARWLLPIVKSFGADTGFDVSHGAIQVLGGAGYTREWPVEQALRDARVMSIYEGTTGIQALDLLQRQLWRDGGAGLEAFLAAARADIAQSRRPDAAAALDQVLGRLEACAGRMSDWAKAPREAEAGATSFLRLATHAATGWAALRLAGLDASDDPAARRIAALGQHWLSDLAPRAAAEADLALLGAARLDRFAAVREADMLR